MITKITDLLVKHGASYSIVSGFDNLCRIRIISADAVCIRALLDNVQGDIFEFKCVDNGQVVNMYPDIAN